MLHLPHLHSENSSIQYPFVPSHGIQEMSEKLKCPASSAFGRVELEGILAYAKIKYLGLGWRSGGLYIQPFIKGLNSVNYTPQRNRILIFQSF